MVITTKPPLLGYLLRLLGLAAVYYVAARLGLRYASIGESISLVWPPTGIAIAGLALLGVRYFPAILIGAYLANSATAIPLAAAGGIALGNTLEAVLGAWLFQRLTGAERHIENLRSVRQFILVVVPIATLLSALVGVTVLQLNGALVERGFGTALLVWWVGDALGALVVAPAVLAWMPYPARVTTGAPRRFIEPALLFLGTVLVSELVLADHTGTPLLAEVDYPYLLFPFVIWAAVRFGSRGASLMTLAVASVTVYHVVAGAGPFITSTPTSTLFGVTFYLAIVACTGLVLAAAIQWERSRAITERMAVEDRLQLAHRAEAVGRLAGGIAHESNNQMSVVLGSVDFLLRRQDLPEEARGDLHHIRRAAERTAAVTAQLLAFSRRQVMRPEVLALNPIITNWAPVLRRAVGEDCTVLLRLNDSIGSIKADPGQLEQVLLNLVLNARDAMPGGGTLTVETFPARIGPGTRSRHPATEMTPGNYVVLAVSDTGHGMNTATMEHIFEPFFTTKQVGHGTGLGLSTVYGIVKQSGGYVWAYSETGRGSTFKIYLPEVALEPAAPDAGAGARPRAGGESILVVEDETQVRAILRRTLEDAGYRVIEAENAVAALELLDANGKIDLVLTDIVMPGPSGRDLGTMIESRLPGIPVLYTSGYTDGEIARRGLLQPSSNFLQKPFSPEVLVNRVGDLLSRSRRP
jgi:signal transduction histidine kinase/CheY-like chemotaxis protein